MSFARFLAIPLVLAVPSLASAQPQPQSLQTMPQPTPDADALAAAIRTLGSNPRDLAALINAGELSLKLGDPTAAAALFKRADEIDPMNGRVKAGVARILVQQERPGEALRYFDQAAGYGLDPRTFAGDRGLAYDLIGEQERAQRDYRLALEAGVQDEVQRRYALSLGISGKRTEALAEIDALLRRSDRGAWRARAFILAMSGDVPGAGVIATRMMPPGMAAGLQPFFEKLPTLPPIDRAFAVHFGETRPTPQRLADARLAPPLPALAPDPRAPTVLAAVDTKPAPAAKRDRRQERELARQAANERRRSAREARPAKVEVAAAAPAPAPALPQAPGYGGGVAFAPPREVVQSVPRTPPPVPAQRPVVPPVTLAARVVASTPAVAAVAIPKPEVLAAAPRSTPPSPGFSTQSVEPLPPAKSSVVPPSAVAAITPTVAAAAPPPAAVAVAVATPKPAPAIAPTVAPVAAAANQAPPTASPPPASVTPAPVVVASAATRPPVSTTAPSRMSEDDILARIIAGISIPASELDVAPVRPAPAPAAGVSVATPASIASAETARRAAEAERQRSATAAAPVPSPAARHGTADAERPAKSAAKAPAEPKPVDTRAAAKKALADKKAAADKKLADAKKVADAKQAAEEKKAAKADPPRIWVQVAGGANESDLPKAWAGVNSKTPALAGRAAYSTPLRATNRVVTGPFKTDAEARAFINSLAKQGVSAFPFTSEKGQKMTKLPPK